MCFQKCLHWNPTYVRNRSNDYQKSVKPRETTFSVLCILDSAVVFLTWSCPFLSLNTAKISLQFRKVYASQSCSMLSVRSKCHNMSPWQMSAILVDDVEGTLRAKHTTDEQYVLRQGPHSHVAPQMAFTLLFVEFCWAHSLVVYDLAKKVVLSLIEIRSRSGAFQRTEDKACTLPPLSGIILNFTEFAKGLKIRLICRFQSFWRLYINRGKFFSFRGLLPDPLTRGSALGAHWGLLRTQIADSFSLPWYTPTFLYPARPVDCGVWQSTHLKGKTCSSYAPFDSKKMKHHLLSSLEDKCFRLFPKGQSTRSFGDDERRYTDSIWL